MSPFRDAMGLINGDEANFRSIDHRNKALVIESFGRYVTMDRQHEPPQPLLRFFISGYVEYDRLLDTKLFRRLTLPTYSNFNSPLRNLSQVSSQTSRLWDESMAAAATPRFFKAST